MGLSTYCENFIKKPLIKIFDDFVANLQKEGMEKGNS